MPVQSPSLPDELGALLPPGFLDLRNKKARVHTYLLKQYEAQRRPGKPNAKTS
jgi:hypothetical protein